ncbi:MAG: HlyD family efflux transporter periplasmic adaptor subunit [Planctomycetota bacterium]
MRSNRIALIALTFILTAGLLWAGIDPPTPSTEELEALLDEAQAEEPAPAEAPATFTVEPTLLNLHVDLAGVFVAEQMTPVSIEPEVWGNFTVVRAVAPGTVVRQGDQLLWLDMTDIDRQIADIEFGEEAAALALTKAQEELRFTEAAYQENFARTERAMRMAEEEYVNFQELVLAYQDQNLAFDEEQMQLSIEMSREEVRQLRRMYEADEFVEETESMVLRRNEFYLRRNELNHEVAVLKFERRESQDLRRRQEDHEWNHASAVRSWEQAQVFMPMGLREKQLQVAQMEYTRERALQKLADLKADRELMIVRAPADGVVFYGECVRGGWPTAGAMDGALRTYGRVGANQIFMTIVQPGAMFVRAEAAEAHLRDLHVGNAARITPTGYPDHQLDGTISDVIILPPGPGQFTVRVRFDGDAGQLMPGMTCKLKLLAYENADALMVPAASVFTEEADEDARYVWLAVDGADPVKTPVEVGRSKGDQIEITDGLASGDAILLEEPSDD